MKRTLLYIAGLTILLIVAGGVWAEGQGQGQESNAASREMPMSVRGPRQGGSRQVDANEMARREQMRQQMREQVSRRRRQADQNAVDANAPRMRVRPEPGGKSTGEQHKQQLTAVEQQLAQEDVKHREHVAKLTRIRELAEKQGDTETVGKVDKLLEQDRQRYEAATQRMERRKKTITDIMEKAAAAPPSADKNKNTVGADTNKH